MKRPPSFKPFFLWSPREIEQEIEREFEQDQAPLPLPEWPRLAFAAGCLRDVLLIWGLMAVAVVVLKVAFIAGAGSRP